VSLLLLPALLALEEGIMELAERVVKSAHHKRALWILRLDPFGNAVQLLGHQLEALPEEVQAERNHAQCFFGLVQIDTCLKAVDEVGPV